MMTFRDKIREAVGEKITNISLYPVSVQPRLWGVTLTKLIDAVTDAVMNRLSFQYGVVIIGASYTGSDEVWWYPTEEERDSMVSDLRTGTRYDLKLVKKLREGKMEYQ